MCWAGSNLFLHQHDLHSIWTIHPSGSIVNGHHSLVYLQYMINNVIVITLCSILMHL